MIVERPRDLRIKKILAHGFLILFLAFITFPFLMDGRSRFLTIVI